MMDKRKTEKTTHEMPRNKANMDQPQEEFIDPQSAHGEPDDAQKQQELKKSTGKK